MAPRKALRCAIALATWLLTSGCGAGWHRIAQAEVQYVASKQQVQVWSGGRAVQLHAVRLTVDSIYGVRFTDDPRCDSCRISIARAGVDSVRTGNPAGGFAGTLGVILVCYALLYWIAGGPQPSS